MTILYYNPTFQQHETGNHPENARRILPAAEYLEAISADASVCRPEWDPISIARLESVHTPHYIRAVEDFANSGGGQIEVDTIVSRESFRVALMAAGAVWDAVARVTAGEDRTAFCLIRPPGHHAMPDHSMGFCLFNQVAVAAQVARSELGIDRVLIVDFDVHHGNGTQAMFYRDPNVGFLSMHRYPFYPGTGHADEIGDGAGRGATLNLPISFGTSRDDQLSLFDTQLKLFASKLRPQLVLLSAGFDSHKSDPVGSLGLESRDFAALTKSVIDVADEHAEGRLVSALEGGYHPTAVGESVRYHLRELMKA